MFSVARAYILRGRGEAEEANLGTRGLGMAWEKNGGHSTQKEQRDPSSSCGWRLVSVHVSGNNGTLALGDGTGGSPGQGVGSDSQVDKH